MPVRSTIGPLTHTTFNNDLNVTSPYTLNIMVGGTAFNAAIALDGSSYTDETTEAGDLTADDMTLAPAVPVAEDAYYLGASKKFNEIAIELSTSAGASTWTHIWEYWNGTAWTALSNVTDNSAAFVNAAGIYHVYWDNPTDWKATTINSRGDYFYVRMRVSAFTSITAQPLGRQARYFMSDKSDWKVSSLKLTFDAASTAQIQSYIHSVSGRSYDFMLDDTTLVSNTAYELIDSADLKFRDHFSITITEAGGQHVYGILTVEEVAPGDY